MGKQYRKLKLKWLEKYKVCYWCGIEVIDHVPKSNEIPPENMATIDHTVSRFFRKKGTRVRKVLACHRCNSGRAKREEIAFKEGRLKIFKKEK